MNSFIKVIRYVVAVSFVLIGLSGLTVIGQGGAGAVLTILICAGLAYFIWPKDKTPKGPTYADQVDQILQSGQLTIETIDNPGFKLKRGEVCLFDQDTSLYLHKRTGTIGGHGISGRIKLAKGIYYRVGVGKIGAPKDWRIEDNGRLVITNKRMLFIGDLKTLSATHTQILDTQISNDGSEMLIKRDKGPDWRFAFGQVAPVERMAGAISYLKGYAQEE
jgi:hypothetical protein